MQFWWLDKHTLSALVVGLLTATSGGRNSRTNSDNNQNPRTNNGNGKGDCDVGPKTTFAQQQQQQEYENCANQNWTGNVNAIPQPTMVTWLVDGNNLSCSRTVPNDRDSILRELRTIASPTSSHSSLSLSSPFESGGAEEDDDETAVSKTKSKPSKKRKSKSPQIAVTTNVFVVFDGNEDEHSERIIATETDLWFRCAVTDGRHRRKDRADDYIVNCAIPHLQKLIGERFRNKQGTSKVHLVSADKELQKRVLATRVMNGGSFVHPPKFWKDYLPVLRKQQQEQRQRQQQEKAETNQ